MIFDPKKYLKVILLVISLGLFLLTFFFHYRPVLISGFSPSSVDANDHAYAVRLLVTDPLLYFRGLISFNTLCDQFPTFECKLLALSTNPPLFYLIGGIFNILPLNEVNVAYFTATVFVSMSVIAMFLIFYYLSKNLILSFVSSLPLAFNLITIWSIQQGLYIAIAGTLFYPLTVYFFYKSVAENRHIYFILSLTGLLLTASYFLIPFLFSVLLLFIATHKQRNILNYLKELFDFFKKNKIYIIPILISIFYLVRVFNVFGPTISANSGQNLFTILDTAMISNYGQNFHEMFLLLPNIFFFVLIGSLVVISYYMRRRLELQFSFLFLSGVIVIFFLPLILSLFISVPFIRNTFIATYIVKNFILLPYVFSVSFFSIFYFLMQFTTNKMHRSLLYITAFGLIIFFLVSNVNTISLGNAIQENVTQGFTVAPKGVNSYYNVLDLWKKYCDIINSRLKNGYITPEYRLLRKEKSVEKLTEVW